MRNSNCLKSLKGRDHSEDPGEDESIILKKIVSEVVDCWVGSGAEVLRTRK